jgi:uncharacterized OB-fold protein
VTLLIPQSEGIALPRPTIVSRPFWDGCADGQLLYQRCARCDTAVFNPAPICPSCLSRDLVWLESAGAGSIYSWTIAHRPMTTSYTAPYAPIIVDLDEGYQMVSNLIGCSIDAVAVGLRVKVVFHAIGTMALPYFRPASEEQQTALDHGADAGDAAGHRST